MLLKFQNQEMQTNPRPSVARRPLSNPVGEAVMMFGRMLPLSPLASNATRGVNDRNPQNPSAGSVVLGLLVAAGAVGGGYWLYKKMNAPSAATPTTGDMRVVQTYAGFNNNPDLWAFAIYNGRQRPGQPAPLIYGPDGPYASQAAAQAAGQSWLAENPPG